MNDRKVEQLIRAIRLNQRRKTEVSPTKTEPPNKKVSLQTDCTTRPSVFNRLYEERLILKNKQQTLEYETRKSREQQEKSFCTFSPNAHLRIRTQMDCQNEESFYIKNIEWLQRKEKEIKKMQCERNQEKMKQITLTPRINKTYNSKNNKENSISRLIGVNTFLERQKKARQQKQYISFRLNTPHAHTWNVKGIFSQIK